MSRHAVALAALLAVQAAHAAAPPDPPVLVPGKSIGPVRLGLTRAEVDALGMAVSPDPSGQLGDAVRHVGPYRVVFSNERVSQVEFVLSTSPRGVRVGEKTVPPTAKPKDAAAALPGCGAEVAAEGGTIIACDGVSVDSAGGLVSLRLTAPAAEATCAKEIGVKAAAMLVEQCLQVTPATHPPCNANNPCELVRDEIRRGCDFLKGEASRPKFCDAP
jgi:hypothetical protein